MALTKVNTDLLADGGKLNGIEAGADVTDTTNVTAAGALMDSELTSIASVKALNQGVATTDSPDFAALNVNGTATMDGLTVDVSSGGATVTAATLKNNGGGANTKARLDFFAASTRYAGISGGYGASSPEMSFDISGTDVLDITSTGIDVTGVVAATSLDISGNIDVDGTTNLDVVDIDGAVDMATTLTVGTKIFTGGMTLTNNDSGRIGFNRNPDTGAAVNSSSLERHQINGANSAGDYLDFQGYNSSGTYVGGFVLNDGAFLTVPTAGKAAVFNDNGVDADFRVESDGNANMLFVDGGNNKVGVGTNFPSYEFVVSKDGSSCIEFGPEGINSTTSFIQFYNRSTALYDTGRFYGSDYQWYLNAAQTGMTLSTTSLVVNESGADSDFRVESDNNANMLTVDAGADLVTISGGSKVTNERLRVNGAQVVGSGDAGVYTLGISNIFAASAAKYLRIQQDGSLFGGLTITATGDYSNVNAIGCFQKIYSIGANSSNTTLFGAGSVTVADLGATSGQFSMGTPTKPNGTTIYIPLANLNASYILAMSLTIEFRGRIAGISSIDIIDQ